MEVGVAVSDRGAWIGQARDHVATAQVVLGEVERGLATVEKVEAVAVRAAPTVRVTVLIALGCATGLIAVVLLTRRRRSRLMTPTGPVLVEDPAP